MFRRLKNCSNSDIYWPSFPTMTSALFTLTFCFYNTDFILCNNHYVFTPSNISWLVKTAYACVKKKVSFFRKQLLILYFYVILKKFVIYSWLKPWMFKSYSLTQTFCSPRLKLISQTQKVIFFKVYLYWNARISD